MNKENPKQPEQKPELFKQKRNYCWLTGYPAERAITRKTPIQQTTKITQQR